MNKLRIAGLAFALVCTVLLGGCGCGGDSGGDTHSNNWDQMIWDQGIWQ
ncbi:MAG: hypothetical protein P1V36_08370 [Planctomycetota bacterium]|nr:hypothetical protein [Planctomycetota bacterium]